MQIEHANMQNFISIVNTSSLRININKGDENNIFTDDPSFFKYFSIDILYDTLIISDKNKPFSYSKNKPLEINIPTILKLEHHGNNDMHVNAIVTDEIKHSGSGTLNIKKTTANKIYDSSFGLLSIKYHKTKKLDIDISKTSSLIIANGDIESLNANIKGVSNCLIEADIEKLSVRSNTVENFEATSVLKYAEIFNESVGSTIVNGPISESCFISNSGVGEVIIYDIDTQVLRIVNNGIGNVKVGGIAENINQVNSGLGDININHLYINPNNTIKPNKRKKSDKAKKVTIESTPKVEKERPSSTDVPKSEPNTHKECMEFLFKIK